MFRRPEKIAAAAARALPLTAQSCYKCGLESPIRYQL